MSNKKIRVNISVDGILLNKAKKRLVFFGGKLSTLFNAYLSDFIKSFDEKYSDNRQELLLKIEELEKKFNKIEKKLSGKLGKDL